MFEMSERADGMLTEASFLQPVSCERSSQKAKRSARFGPNFLTAPIGCMHVFGITQKRGTRLGRPSLLERAPPSS
jgi:hypothetical protein